MKRYHFKRIMSTVIILTATLLGVSTGKANLITNGSFETGFNPPTSGYRLLGEEQWGEAYDDIDGWIVSSNYIDWVHNSYWTSAEGDRSIDMNGVAAGALTTATPFATTPGLVYEVVFYLSGNFGGGDTTEALQISADGQTGTFSFTKFTDWSYENMGWSKKIWTFIADDNSANLTFTSLEPISDDGGPVLDNVSVNAVPIPPTVFLLGSGLLRLVGWRRFKKG